MGKLGLLFTLTQDTNYFHCILGWVITRAFIRYTNPEYLGDIDLAKKETIANSDFLGPRNRVLSPAIEFHERKECFQNSPEVPFCATKFLPQIRYFSPSFELPD
ncbi:hypothetical protein V3481_004518 [Fusarium oxysporum f. sp. vasinfectum]